MKKIPVLFIFLFCFCSAVFTQKIQYSRGTFHINNIEGTQFVSNIAGYYHLLYFDFNEKPSIHIFNSQLQLIGKKEIDILIKKNCDVRVLPFANYYFLYTHIVKDSKHELWKIDKVGNSTSISEKFQRIIDSVFTKYTATFQLINDEGKLFLLATTYYDSLKRLGCMIIQFDNDLNPTHVSTVLIPFISQTESLQQTVLAGGNLFALKISKNEETGNLLSLMKIELSTGEIITNSFNSGSFINTYPAFILSNQDSTIIIYSILMAPSLGRGAQRNILLSKLDYKLREKVPVTILKSQFRQNILSNFLLFEGTQSVWVNVYNSPRLQRINSEGPDLSNSFNQPSAIRFSVLDDQFKFKSDSLVANNKKIIEVQPHPFAQFILNNKGYLILVQNFTRKQRGLLMVGSTAKGHFSTVPIPVYDRYNYLLTQLQLINNSYFIVPFVTKSEIGLMKVTVADEEVKTSNSGN
jgi:hypothetical protein